MNNKPHTEDTAADEFFNAIKELDSNESYKRYIESSLPNEGQSIAEICSTGFEKYRQSYKDINFA